MGLGKKMFYSITDTDTGAWRWGRGRPLTIFKGKQEGVIMFTEYTTTRTRKAPEDLTSNKQWQPRGRRLYLPLNTSIYGLEVKEWTEDGRKHHKVEWKHKPYCKLLLNKDPDHKDFAQVEVNKDGKGLAVQVDPANHKRVYVSIPAGAVDRFPEAACNLKCKKQAHKDVWTLSSK